MSQLKPGTLCVIVGGCPENIGLIVEVICHLGRVPPRDDAYKIKTVSDRRFAQLWGADGKLVDGYSNVAITDRHKLRPLPDICDETDLIAEVSRERALDACHGRGVDVLQEATSLRVKQYDC